MTSFFLCPIEPPNWHIESDLRISPREFARRIQQRWPKATIVKPDDTKLCYLGWELPNGLEGELKEDQQIVVIDGSIDAIAEYAIWHRSIIEERHDLYLFHESLSFVLKLTAETTHQDILHALK